MAHRAVAWSMRLRTRLMLRGRAWQRQLQPLLPPNADAITPQLFVGGFIDTADWRQLVEQGIDVVVSLQGERHDEGVFGELQPAAYLRLPTRDWTPPSTAQLRMGAALIDEAIRAGHKVLVHCHAGVGRSTLQCGAYLVFTGMTLDEAWQLIKTKRPRAEWNERQQRAIEEFAAAVAAERRAVSVPIDGPAA